MSHFIFDWDPEKSAALLLQRGLCFEDVVAAAEDGRVLADIPHHNAEHFAHQRILVVEIAGYACGVPYVLEGEVRFLKTIYPSRALTRRYMKQSRP